MARWSGKRQATARSCAGVSFRNDRYVRRAAIGRESRPPLPGGPQGSVLQRADQLFPQHDNRTSLGALIPAGDDPVEAFADDGVFGRSYNRDKFTHLSLRRFVLFDIAHVLHMLG